VKDASKALAVFVSEGASEASVSSGGAPATETMVEVGMSAAESTQSHGSAFRRYTFRPDATTGLWSLFDLATAVFSLTKRAALSGRPSGFIQAHYIETLIGDDHADT